MGGEEKRAWRWRRREPAAFTWPRRALYRAGWILTRWVVAPLLGGLEVSGIENVPREGGAIIAPNHNSHLDPPYVGAALRRPTYFMAKRELFEVPIFGWLIYNVFAYPVERGTPDRFAIRKAIELVSAGHLVLIFPEGTRSPDGTIQEGELGPAMVAARAGVPIIPCAVSGTRRILPPGAKWPRRARTYVAFGEPVHVKTESNDRLTRSILEAATAELMQRLKALHAELEAKRQDR